MTKRKTINEFKKEVYDLVGNEYTILSNNYINNKTKIKIKHNICNYEYEVTPHSFLQGCRCPKCSGLMKKTDNEFKKEVYDLVGNEYTFLQKYNGVRTKLLVKHNVCGYEYEVRPNDFLYNSKRCPKCAKNLKILKEDFINYLNIIDDRYTLLSEYKNYSTKVLLKHEKCGYEYEVFPKYFMYNKNRCPKCAKNLKRDINDIKNIINNLSNEYDVLSKYYKNIHSKLKIRHKICGYEFITEAECFINHLKDNKQCCANCSGKIKKTIEQFKQEVFDLVGNEYTVLGDEYVNNSTKILMKHNKCGNEYLVKPNDFLSFKRCPKCRESKGEKIICNYLDCNNVHYNQQVSFPDCKYKRPLIFDFQILLENSNNIILLEYDGIQHFKSSFSDKTFKDQQLRDNIKNEYCKSQGIHLYRIPYTEFENIESILNKIIEKESSTTIERII